MKYIDADKLIAEIERRLKSLHEWKTGWERRLPLSRNKTYYKNSGKESAYDAILNIVVSLQQEQSEVDLEKALDEYYKNEDFGPSEAIEYEIHKDIARYFYELGCRRTAEMYDDIEYNRQRAEEAELSGDLEEEIEWEWIHREKQEVDFIECAEMDKEEFARFVRHFYELGLNARTKI